MRSIDPDDVDRLATLLDGRDGIADKLDEAMARAARLGVSSHLTPLKPLRTWATTTAPDLRSRAAIARLEDGDPDAGLKWAGFGAKEIAAAGVYAKAPGVALIAQALAVGGGPEAEACRRRSRESLDDRVDRLRAHGIARIPVLKPYEKEIGELLGGISDVATVTDHGSRAAFHQVNLTRVLVGNSFAQGVLNDRKQNLVALLREVSGRWGWRRAGVWADRVDNFSPPVRSLSAPGTWMPSRLAELGSGSAVYDDVRRIPFLNSQFLTQIGEGYDRFRGTRVMRTRVLFGMTGDRLVNRLVGSDDLAHRFGGLSHSGRQVTRAGNASYLKVGKNAFAAARQEGAGRLAAAGEGLRTAGRMGGLMRGAGVVGGVYSTVYSGANVWAQGSPASHFGSRVEGAKYVADVAEVGFNASLTAATVAPNPFTIGAVALTGTVYAGAKAVEHWDGIKRGAGQAADRVGDKAKDLGKSIAKSRANPMNWF
ncbi:PE-PGRS family protein [Streptomyces sp. NPDC096080]|uniref:PE-PGRS family protein n=1 Tax=Streptomyces sp. NPDC096080 TaxID=3156693 RepID=UPI00332B935D